MSLLVNGDSLPVAQAQLGPDFLLLGVVAVPAIYWSMSEKEYVESRLPKYPGVEFRRFNVEEYYAIFELDCLPEGTSQELWDGVIFEKYTDMKPRMFRRAEFETILAAGIIKPEEQAQLVDGFILVPRAQPG